MVGSMGRHKVRQYVLWLVAADFPLLYIGAVTIEDATLSVATLVVLAVASALAAWAY